MGRACARNDFPLLLLAHHNDDQAETVLLRLAAGHRGLGLKPIKDLAKIPECWGIHNVGSTICSDPFIDNLNSKDVSDYGRPFDSSTASSQGLQVFESGDVTLMRPLLAFGKDQLIRLCQDNFIPWEEDETNKDFTLTPRNTIRHMLKKHALPKVLQKTSLLRLAQAVEEKNRLVQVTSADLFRQCEILRLDVRSGSIIVKIPPKVAQHVSAQKYGSFSDHTAASLLRTLMSPVSPRADIPLDSLENAVHAVFAPRQPTNQTTSEAHIRPASFTAGGVRFELLSPAESSYQVQPVSKDEESQPEADTWMLSRQPESNPARIPIFPTCHTILNELTKWTPWQLHDGRHWFRFRLRTGLPTVTPPLTPSPSSLPDTVPFLSLRPLSADDMSTLRKHTSPAHFARLRATLRTCARGKTRWTIPAIVVAAVAGRQTAEADDDAADRVLALPTFGAEAVFDDDLEYDQDAALTLTSNHEGANNGCGLDHTSTTLAPPSPLSPISPPPARQDNTDNAAAAEKAEPEATNTPIFRAGLPHSRPDVVLEWQVRYKGIGPLWTLQAQAQQEQRPDWLVSW